MKKILLVGYYGFGNLGDELMRISIKKFLKRENYQVVELLPKEVKYENAYSRFNIISVLNAISKSDIVICGGGGVLQDKTSFRSFMYYYLIFKISLFLRKPVIFFGNSFGPFKRYLSRILFKDLLRNKKLYIFSRDEVSYKYVKKYNNKAFIYTDPSIPILSEEKYEKKVQRKAVIVPRKFRSYVPVLLCLANQGFTNVVFAPFSPEDVPLAKRLSNFSVKKLKVSYCDVEDSISHIKQSELVISERFHGALIAAYFEVPFISLKDEKFRRFFHKYQKDYNGYAKGIIEASYKISKVKGIKLQVRKQMEEDAKEMYEKLKNLIHNLA
ncbi:polysaccharide pyruvyl transferase family protein [Thermosipho atlanticus]|uniref:Polysaccharide pyruvyl transferase CsaB n=1 Tax=Thermosipho atlanticus DSM 15807 TaxID=1123380 RepID=A0A1M5QQJ9_9BACT|nr:polysaccharide pyruvyl transferase family protein [Thermosipho atlanticus]SHH16218.1 polysaccharide pyruvyl transferase CsaB [Thermosipho atlanticus DSM 15807]